MTLHALLDIYEATLAKYEDKTRRTRLSILKRFKETWNHGLDIHVKAITPLQVELWLSGEKARLKNPSYNEYIRFVRPDATRLRLGPRLRIIPRWPHLVGLVFPHSQVGSLPDFAIDHPVRNSNHAGGVGSWELFLSLTESSSPNAICLPFFAVHPQFQKCQEFPLSINPQFYALSLAAHLSRFCAGR